jgi:hypothetical protein
MASPRGANFWKVGMLLTMAWSVAGVHTATPAISATEQEKRLRTQGVCRARIARLDFTGRAFAIARTPWPARQKNDEASALCFFAPDRA